MMKKNKMKRTNKAISGLIAGAAIGVLTFMVVKPKVVNKKKDDTNQSRNLQASENYNPENLFI